MVKGRGIVLTVLIVVLSGIGWLAIFRLNGDLFSRLQEQMGVNWIFLPEGFLLLGVLLFGWRCCLGIFLASFVAGYWLFAPNHIGVIPVAGAIAGFSPLLAIWLLKSRFPVKRDLSDMTAIKLLVYGLVFSALSAVLNQLAFLAVGITPAQHWPEAVWAMFTGDLAGVLIVLGLASLLLRLIKKLPSRSRWSAS